MRLEFVPFFEDPLIKRRVLGNIPRITTNPHLSDENY